MTQLMLERFESQAASALHAPDPEVDAALEAAAEAKALEEERAAAQAAREEALAGALGKLAEAVARSRKGAIDAVCTDVGQVVAQALPGLIGPNFPEEVARASIEIIDASGTAQASLRVSPEDEATVVTALKRVPPERPITVIADPAVTGGEARLDWGTGGAVIDAEAWGESMKTLLSAHLEARRNEGIQG